MADRPGRRGRLADDDLLDVLPDVLVCIEGDQRIVAWNRAAEHLYGYTREEALGRRAPDLLETRFGAPLDELVETCARTGRWHGTIVNRAKDGRAVTVDTRWSAQYDEAGACVGVIALGRELLTASGAQADAETAEPDALAAVTAAVAHDLRNVLAVVVNYAALLARELQALHEESGEQRWATLAGDAGEIRSAAARGVALTRVLSAASLAAEQGGQPA